MFVLKDERLYQGIGDRQKDELYANVNDVSLDFIDAFVRNGIIIARIRTRTREFLVTVKEIED